MKKMEPKEDTFISLQLIEEGSGEYITTLNLTFDQTINLLQFAIVRGLKDQIKFIEENKEKKDV